MGKTASRKAFGEALSELGDKYKNVVCLDADLSKSTMSILFKNKFLSNYIKRSSEEFCKRLYTISNELISSGDITTLAIAVFS